MKAFVNRNIRLRVYALFLGLFGAASHVFAQCPEFDRLMQEGDRRVQSSDYKRAVNSYLSAKLDCPERESEAQERIQRIMSIASDLQRMAKARQDSVDRLRTLLSTKLRLIDSVNQKYEESNDSLLAVKKRVESLEGLLKQVEQTYYDLVDSMPLLGRPITLATKIVSGVRKFYYINQQGVQIDTLGEWDDATQFQLDGYARVKKSDMHYLIDEHGKRRRMSISGNKTSDHAIDYSFEKRVWLPEKVYEMDSLEILVAAENSIRWIPMRMDHLFRLAYLNLASNRLKRMKNVTRNRALEKLDLHDNEIREIASEISNLNSLKELNLCHNLISKLPLQLFQLDVLQDLELEYNEIQRLDTAIYGLKNLHRLELSFNKLQTVPCQITKMQSLEYLGLTGNRVRITKDDNPFTAIKKLQKLKILRIGANPCTQTKAQRDALRREFEIALPKCLVIFH